MAARASLDPVADLKRRLARARDPAGVVERWWSDHGFEALPATVGKRVALALIEQPRADAKLAGILVLQGPLADHLRTADLAAFAKRFDGGLLTDELADVFGIKVLGTMLLQTRGRAEIARALASWRLGDTAWQRRAACAAFTALAPQGDAALPGLAQMIFQLCATMLWSIERPDQMAVGWLLRELSRGEPARVEAFFRRHARFMSRECARHAIERLPAARQKDLLAVWKRATTLRRS